MTAELSEQETATEAPTRVTSKWAILVVVALAELMVVLDNTVVSVALPKAQAALHISDASRQWVVTAYALTFGGLLLLGGRLADYWGRKRTFMTGMVGFTIASALGGLAQNAGELFSARAVQGMFGAMLAPAALSLLQVTFDGSKDRAKAFAVYGLIAGGGSGVGLVIGGLVTEYASWRWCLLINVPVAIIALSAAVPLLEESRTPAHGKYDVPGAITVTVGLGCLVYGFNQAAQPGQGWQSGVTLTFLGAAVVLLTGFVLIENSSAHPLLPLRIIRERTRIGAYVTSMLAGAALFGGLLFLTYYFQGTLHYSALQSGLSSVPIIGVLLLAAPGVTFLVIKVGPRFPMVAGAIVASGAMALLTRIGPTPAYASHLLPALLLLGFGLSLLFVPLANVALVNIPPEDAGAASALVGAAQQVGGAVGTALFNTIYAGAVAAYLSSHLPATPAAAATLTTRSLLHGYTTSFTWAAVAMLVAAAVAFALIRIKPGVSLPNGLPAH